MSAAVERPREFHCARWPGCGCPDGTVARDCPGRTIPMHWLTATEAIAAARTRKAANEQMTLEQAVAISQRISKRHPRKITGEALIADMNTLLIRCERGLAELNAIHTELSMIRNDMAQLHGLPKG